MDKILHSCFNIKNFTRDQEIKLKTYFEKKQNHCSYLIYLIKADELDTHLLKGYIQWMIPIPYRDLEHAWRAHFTTPVSSAKETIYDLQAEAFESELQSQQIENQVIQCDLVEMGNFRKIKTKVTARDWEIAQKCISDNTADRINSKIFIKYYKNVMNSFTQNRVRPADLNGELQNLWIWGPPGIGKTKLANMIVNGAIYPKNKDKYWPNYKSEDWVIIEDIEIDDQWIGAYLRVWGDRYAFNGELEESSICIRPKHIIVTSYYSIDKVFGEERMNDNFEMLNALTRRFSSVCLSSNGDNPLSTRNLTEIRNRTWRIWKIL